MTRKELSEVKQDYKAQIRSILTANTDITIWITAFCMSLAEEPCYNHHERGQRLWAFAQALNEVEKEE